MSASLHLTVTTPLAIVLDVGDVASLRAEDASGGFGILPGHADFLTVMDAGVLRWRPADGPWRFAALRGGVLTVRNGRSVNVACREAIVGDDLASLQADVAAVKTAAAEAARSARTRQMRLHARAVREIMQRMNGSTEVDAALAEVFE